MIELSNKSYEHDINWFEWEWGWVRESKTYSSTSANIDLYSVGKKILM